MFKAQRSEEVGRFPGRVQTDKPLVRCSLPVSSAVKVFQPYKASSSNGTARVRCFLHPRPHVRVTLLRGFHGDQEVCSTILHLSKRVFQVKCSARESEGAVVVTVSGLRAEDTDVYRCEIQILYPPPYLRLRGNGTLVHVSGQDDCGCPAKGSQQQQLETDLIFCFCVIIIIICVFPCADSPV
uniref:Immunoglobulin V-set domain-containing protein n=1 Tax=Scophthalmus maximus TaxID=52904 RepID=A0A8D3D8U6_SCOMX